MSNAVEHDSSQRLIHNPLWNPTLVTAHTSITYQQSLVGQLTAVTFHITGSNYMLRQIKLPESDTDTI